MRALARRSMIGPKFHSGRGLVVLLSQTTRGLTATRFLRRNAPAGLCRLDEEGFMFSAVVLVLGCLLQMKLVTTEGHRGTNRHVFYAVQMDGGVRAARGLVEQHGLEFIQRSETPPPRRSALMGTMSPGTASHGEWDERAKNGIEIEVGSLEDVYTLRDSRGRPDRATFENRLASTEGVHLVQRQHSHYRDKRVPVTGPEPGSAHSSQRRESATDRQLKENTSDQSLTFNDPLWPMQWELFAQGQYNSSGFDLNVMPVWRNNITGNGVVVSIIDDVKRVTDLCQCPTTTSTTVIYVSVTPQ
ncbi:PC3-like endoprotease variant A [Larimichthys crocea]|uniref:PC3-like endoprotease variant A n=1 Tax=Larimichthys crocea TaxID=215358 RepID=A0A6G0IAV5_LARCR|nr:PC3-like endoprotease variant A [Larimichthys crocea]